MLQRIAIFGTGMSHLERLYLEVVRAYRKNPHLDALLKGFSSATASIVLRGVRSMLGLVQVE